MIDWITCMISVDTLPVFGKRTITDEYGVIEKVTTLPKHIESSSTSVFVLPWDEGLLISGNCTKFIQGHNVFGVDDWRIVDAFLNKLMFKLGVNYYCINKVTRLDINYGLVFNSHNDVGLALQEIGNTTAERWGRPVSKMGTQYFGTRKRQQLKIYAKAPEFSRTNKVYEFKNIVIPPILRPELTLGRNHFEDNDWRQYTEQAVRSAAWESAMSRIRVNELETFDSSVLPRNLLKVYGIWRSGVDLKAIYKIGTLYNYASELRKYGIDIWQQPIKSNVINLQRSLEARPLTAEDVEKMGFPVWRPIECIK